VVKTEGKDDTSTIGTSFPVPLTERDDEKGKRARELSEKLIGRANQ